MEETQNLFNDYNYKKQKVEEPVHIELEKSDEKPQAKNQTLSVKKIRGRPKQKEDIKPMHTTPNKLHEKNIDYRLVWAYLGWAFFAYIVFMTWYCIENINWIISIIGG